MDVKKITVQVKTHAKKQRVVACGNNHYCVYLSVAPRNGAANRAAQVLLATYFGVPRRNVLITHGATSPQKRYEIMFHTV